MRHVALLATFYFTRQQLFLFSSFFQDQMKDADFLKPWRPQPPRQGKVTTTTTVSSS